MNYYIFHINWYPREWFRTWQWPYVDRNETLGIKVLYIHLGGLQIVVGKSFGA